MITKLALEKTEETFTLLGNYFPGYNKNRAMYGIGLKLKNQETCEEFAANLKIEIAKADKDNVKLNRMKETYNRRFPSKDKNSLTTPHVLYNTIRSTISDMKKNILKFCPRNTRRAAGTYTTPTQTLGASYLCNQAPYSNDMYPGLYPDYIQEVLDLLDEYSQVATENILLCQDLLEEERLIREDDDALREIDAECRAELEELACALDEGDLLKITGISKADWERRKKEAKSMKEMRRALYHNITPKEYQIRVVKDFVMEGLANGLTQEESAIWTKEEDYDFVKFKVRPAIEGMSKKADLPNQKKRNAEGKMVKSEYIAYFMKWCRVPKGKTQEFFLYLQKGFANAPLLLPNYKSVLGAAKKPLASNIKQEYEQEFESYSLD